MSCLKQNMLKQVPNLGESWLKDIHHIKYMHIYTHTHISIGTQIPTLLKTLQQLPN